MREIKFRGISQYSGKMVYGQLLRGDNNFSIVIDFGMISTIQLEPIVKGTQSQYTGLKDENGRGIYEGDITIDGYGTVTVIENDGFQWLERIVRLRDRHISKEILIMTKANAFRCEVIGNIYENPELLEGE